MQVIPFFLSALLFMSGFFSIFAPLPLMILALQGRKSSAVAAGVTNAVIVFFLAGPTSFALYASFVLVLAGVLSEALRRGVRVERAALATLTAILVTCAVWLTFQSQINGISPAAELKIQIDGVVTAVEQSLSERARQALIESAGPPGTTFTAEEWKKSFIAELPSALFIFTLLMVWSNLWLVLRINPGGVRGLLRIELDYFRRWRSPEWLVWPTILSGAAIVSSFWLKLPSGVPEAALNIFKVIMAVYVMQGLSILSFGLAAWKVTPFFRALAFIAAVFAMIPLVLSIGFFDLWFDFRAKIRQS